MEHLEEILFNAERGLQRRYPSKASQIADATKDLWHLNAVTTFYCASRMSKAIGVPAEAVAPFYYHAETRAEMAEDLRQEAIRTSRRRRMIGMWALWALWAVIVVLLYGIRGCHAA